MWSVTITFTGQSVLSINSKESSHPDLASSQTIVQKTNVTVHSAKYSSFNREAAPDANFC